MNNMRKKRKKVSQTHLDATSIKANDSMAEEMSESEFRMYIIKMIREALNDCTNQ